MIPPIGRGGKPLGLGAGATAAATLSGKFPIGLLALCVAQHPKRDHRINSIGANKKPPGRGGFADGLLLFPEELQFRPEKYRSVLKPREERAVSRILLFFNPSKSLLFKKTTLYQ
jgi:hypothetical protein